MRFFSLVRIESVHLLFMARAHRELSMMNFKRADFSINTKDMNLFASAGDPSDPHFCVFRILLLKAFPSF